MNTPITHGGVYRGYKQCKCSECGVVAECTPWNDFYVREGTQPDGLLVCEKCILGDRKLIATIGPNPLN